MAVETTSGIAPVVMASCVPMLAEFWELAEVVEPALRAGSPFEFVAVFFSSAFVVAGCAEMELCLTAEASLGRSIVENVAATLDAALPFPLPWPMRDDAEAA